MNCVYKFFLIISLFCGVFTQVGAGDPFEGVSKILVVGNSLSRHAPLPAEKWNGNWGMAATTEDKDYLHVLKKELDRLYPEKPHTIKIFRPGNEADMTLGTEIVKEKADLVIVQVGENFRGQCTPGDLGAKYKIMLQTLKKRVSPNIICVGTWALGAEKNPCGEVEEAAAHQLNIPYVPIFDLAKVGNSGFHDPNLAHTGDPVKWHPSDKGMKAIADKIIALSPRLSKEKMKALRPKSTAPSENASISVDCNRITGKVNRKVMGQFIEGADGQYIWANDTPNMEIRNNGDGAWLSGKECPDPQVVKLMAALKPGVIRYPGGSEVKNWNWKKVVGPMSNRDEGWHWGLVEFIRFCREVGSEPQICLSEYVGGPEDQRDMVEFLNSPATPDHPWAMKRAEWGHKEPFKVKYFELGNEPYDGNRRVKPRKQWDALGYANWAKTTAQLMKSVDPSIKIGLPNGGFGKENDDKINRIVGPYVDFVIYHSYSVGYAGNRTLSPSEVDCIMRACMAAAPQSMAILNKCQQDFTRLTGRDLEIAITEYNTEMQSETPVPFRKSMGAGLFCSDFIFNMMQPKNKVLLANYWQIVNGYWGSIITKDNYKLLPPYYCFKIIAENLGDNLLEPKVVCPKIDFEGFYHVRPAKGNAHTQSKTLPQNYYNSKYVFLPPEGMKYPGLTVKRVKDEIHFIMDKYTQSNYPGFATINIDSLPEKIRPESGMAYEVSFEACLKKSDGSASLNLGIGVMDARGWDKAGSAIGIEGVDKPQWEKFSGIYPPLKDTKQIILLGRLLAGNDPVTGVMRVRNITFKPVIQETFPAYEALSVLTSRTANKVYVAIINKYTDRQVRTKIALENFVPSSATISRLVTPNAFSATDVFLSSDERAAISGNSVDVVLDPHSITAITFEK